MTVQLSLLGFMQYEAAETSAVSLFLHCAPQLFVSLSRQTGGSYLQVGTYQYGHPAGGRDLSSGTNMQQVDSRRSMAIPFSICHQPRLWRYASTSLVQAGLAPFPTPSGRISRYRKWQGPNGLTSLDRDPIRVRNTVRLYAALPPCRHYEPVQQVQRFQRVGPCLVSTA